MDTKPIEVSVICTQSLSSVWRLNGLGVVMGLRVSGEWLAGEGGRGGGGVEGKLVDQPRDGAHGAFDATALLPSLTHPLSAAYQISKHLPNH